MVAQRRLGFKKNLFEAGKLWRTNMCDYTKFQQKRPDGFGDIAIIRFSRWSPSLGF